MLAEAEIRAELEQKLRADEDKLRWQGVPPHVVTTWARMEGEEEGRIFLPRRG